MGLWDRFSDYCEAKNELEDYGRHQRDRGDDQETEEYHRLNDRVADKSSWLWG